ncbi:MAG: hypothetical protein KDD12_14000 [Lewinella sp.]|nr:hypothetical protein [Lewinella sp.]
MAPMFTKVFTGVFKNPNRTRLTAFLITALLVLGSLDSQAQFTIPLCSTSLQVATFPSMISCGSDPCTFSWTGSPGLSFSCPACDETTISSSTPGVYSATLHFNNGALNFTVTLGAVDADNDGYLNCDDCNDNNALEKPGQVWYKDLDNDGYGDAFSGPITQCARPIGYKLAFELVALNTDCDDNYNSVHPGAPEICDGLDNNCNNMTDEGVGATYYRDQDGDGYGNPAMGLQACSPPQGYVSNNSDCNDGSPLEKPGQVWYKDSDNDGYAATGAATITQCQRPGGYKAQSELTATTGDCNDNNGAIHPGASEVCDGVDNNCNNAIDEGVLGTYYRDQDEDGFGDPAVSQQSCSPPPGYVTDNTDCNDNNPSEKPGQVWYLDSDGDGYGDSGVSQVSCTQPEGYAPAGGDCNDNNPDIHPNAIDDVCNGIDEDCSGTAAADDVPPTAICRPVTVQLDANGMGTTSEAAVDNGSNDDCGIQSAVLSRQSFSCSDVGANTVTLTVTDANNNASTCTATVFVEDDINPVALCRNITVLLDGDGQGEVTAQQVDNGSSDACGILTLELNQTKVDCNNVGNVSVTLTATDINGNDGICSATVSVVDPVAPEALCQNVTVQLDENGDGSTAAAAVDNGSNDACGIQSAVLSGQSFSCSDVGANTVTLTVTDVNNNASTCTATVSVEDHVAPTALCRNVTVQFDENGEASTTAAAVDNGSNDACGVQSVVLSQEAFSCTDPGPVAVTLTVTDVNGNTSTCTASVTIEDHINPEVDCSAITVSFTGEASLTLEPEGMATASDNCAVTGFEADPPSISCADLGETLPVTVTVRDPSGNTASCIAHVTVEGLPCGWTSMSDGIGCTNGNDVDYDAQNGTFTMMATGCYTPGATSDESGYINYRLCGDGSITAHIAGLTLPGFAGIVMRESEAPGAKKVAMAYQGVNAIARYVRYATNGAAYPSYINTPGSRWLRIVRAGNVFRGYHSVNGVTWTYAFAVTVPMDDCIQVGLIAWGTNANSAVTATFDHVGIDPPFGATVQRGTVIPQVTDLPDSAAPGAELWPNPASGAVMLKLTGAWADAEAGQAELEVAVFDEFGRQLLTIQPDALFDPVINLDLSGRPAGVYLVRVKNARGTTIIQKLVLTDR